MEHVNNGWILNDILVLNYVGCSYIV